MDQPSHPGADDLGLSEIEYERIRRDMQRRGLAPPPASAPSGLPSAPPSTEPAPRRRPRKRLAVLAVAALVVAAGKVATHDSGPAYAYMVSSNGEPVTYSSCRVIQVAVYPAGGPPNAEALVREAVDQVKAATGLKVVVSGSFGGHAPNWNFEAGPVYPDDPIVVSWQDGNAIARLSGDTVGLGGSRVVSASNGGERLVAGTVALSRDFYAKLVRDHDHRREVQVLLHELGHVFGLDHVDRHDEIMYPSVSNLAAYGPGDLVGLSRLGRGPCT